MSGSSDNIVGSDDNQPLVSIGYGSQQPLGLVSIDYGYSVGYSSSSHPIYNINSLYVGVLPKNPKSDTIYIGDKRQIILIKNGEEIELFATIKSLTAQIQDLTKRLEVFELEVKYTPGEEGYQQAKENFETIKEEW